MRSASTADFFSGVSHDASAVSASAPSRPATRKSMRKVRLAQSAVGRGKRGGARVYYLDLAARGVTYLVAIFGKREKSDLTLAERKAVAALVKLLKEES